MALRLHRRALLWHRLVRRRRAAARVGEATRGNGSAWSARLGDGSESTARLSDGAARLWAAVARQGSALPRQGKARIRRSQPHRLSEARPRHWLRRSDSRRVSLDSHRDGIALMRLAPRRHGQGTHRKGVAQSRKAAALLWTAWPGTATAKVREAMRCQGIARLSWRRRTPQRMSIAWLGWGRASGCLAGAEHRIALH